MERGRIREVSPKIRVNSGKLVTSTGGPEVGPRMVIPTKPVVLVLTPAMGSGPETSSI